MCGLTSLDCSLFFAPLKTDHSFSFSLSWLEAIAIRLEAVCLRHLEVVLFAMKKSVLNEEWPSPKRRRCSNTNASNTWTSNTNKPYSGYIWCDIILQNQFMLACQSFTWLLSYSLGSTALGRTQASVSAPCRGSRRSSSCHSSVQFLAWPQNVFNRSTSYHKHRDFKQLKVSQQSQIRKYIATLPVKAVANAMNAANAPRP